MPSRPGAVDYRAAGKGCAALLAVLAVAWGLVVGLVWTVVWVTRW